MPLSLSLVLLPPGSTGSHSFTPYSYSLTTNMHLFAVLLCSILATAPGRCAPSIPFEGENTETRMDTNIQSSGKIAFSDGSLLATLDPLLDLPDRSQEAIEASAWYKASPSAGFSKTESLHHTAILAANEGAFVINGTIFAISHSLTRSFILPCRNWRRHSRFHQEGAARPYPLPEAHNTTRRDFVPPTPRGICGVYGRPRFHRSR
jgi:hypothetical protein